MVVTNGDCFIRISIHALREESDRKKDSDLQKYFHFYPRPPRGERPTCGAA